LLGEQAAQKIGLRNEVRRPGKLDRRERLADAHN
jgi:hypothetical protein